MKFTFWRELCDFYLNLHLQRDHQKHTTYLFHGVIHGSVLFSIVKQVLERYQYTVICRSMQWWVTTAITKGTPIGASKIIWIHWHGKQRSICWCKAVIGYENTIEPAVGGSRYQYEHCSLFLLISCFLQTIFYHFCFFFMHQFFHSPICNFQFQSTVSTNIIAMILASHH